MFVSLGRDRWSGDDGVFGDVVAEPRVVEFDVAVRSVGRDGQKERLVRGNGIVQKPVGLLGQHVGRVFAFVADGLFVVALETGVQVFVRVRVEQEVRSRKPGDEGGVIVL